MGKTSKRATGEPAKIISLIKTITLFERRREVERRQDKSEAEQVGPSNIHSGDLLLQVTWRRTFVPENKEEL